MVDQITLRQLVVLDVNYNGLYIEYTDVVVPFELKSGLIHLLPRFSGLAGEDPHKHLKEFQIFCSTLLRPKGITEDHIKLRVFPFSLQGAAKDWLYYLAPNSVTSWNDLKMVFLETFFPPQVTTFSSSGPSLEDLVKQMAMNNLQYQQQIDSTLQTLQTQIGQLSTLMNAMQQAQGSNQQPLEEHSIFQIESLYENVDDTRNDLLSSDFPSLSDFDDVYSCSDCTDTNVCVVCAEINDALQGDIFPIGEVVDEVVYAVELEISAAQNSPSVEQPPSLESELLPEDLNYSSKTEFENEEKSLKKHRNGIGWALIDILDIIPSCNEHKISLSGEEKLVRQPFQPLIFDVVINTFTCGFDTFTFRRLFFDPGIKGEGTKINFKVNVHRIRLFHESPTLEAEIVKEASLAKAVYAITYPP